MRMKIDSIILFYLERGLHHFQKLTGKDNFWIARQLIPFFILILVLSTGLEITVLRYPRDFNIPLNMIKILFLAMFIWMLLVLLARKINTEEKLAYWRLENGFPNPEKFIPQNQASRAGKLIFSTLFFGVCIYYKELTSAGFVICMPIFMYILTCDPLPQRKSKIREWLESFHKAPTTQPVAT